MIASQIGRPPRGRWQVARRCACGLPQVIETYPRLDDGTPFPTRYWLTCRSLSAAVGRIESKQMAEFNQMLGDDQELRDELAASIDRYVRNRDEIEPLGATGHPGGGPDRVKCLHAHVAQYLITGDDPAGRWTLEQMGWEEPQEPCI